MVFVLVEVFGAASRSAAVTAVLVVRICTLWFAVLVGVGALGLLKHHLGKQGFGQVVRSALLDGGQGGVTSDGV